MTKAEKIEALYREVNKFVDEDTFKPYIGEVIRGFDFETADYPEKDEMIALAKLSANLARSIADAIHPLHQYDLMLVLKDKGPVDDSEEATIERERIRYRNKKKEEEFNAKMRAIRDEPDDD